LRDRQDLIAIWEASGQNGRDRGRVFVTEQNEPVIVICMKWGTLYGPDYVKVLYNAIADNLDIPFRHI